MRAHTHTPHTWWKLFAIYFDITTVSHCKLPLPRHCHIVGETFCSIRLRRQQRQRWRRRHTHGECTMHVYRFAKCVFHLEWNDLAFSWLLALLAVSMCVCVCEAFADYLYTLYMGLEVYLATLNISILNFIQAVVGCFKIVKDKFPPFYQTAILHCSFRKCALFAPHTRSYNLCKCKMRMFALVRRTCCRVCHLRIVHMHAISHTHIQSIGWRLVFHTHTNRPNLNYQS